MEKAREAFRWLLLPVDAAAEEAAVSVALAELESQAVDLADLPIWLRLELDAWKGSTLPSPQMEAVVSAYIAAGADQLSETLAAEYFDLHRKLSGQPQLGHERASALLSHARLIALLSGEALSAAQIAKIIGVRDSRTPVSWRPIQTILSGLKTRQALPLEDVRKTFEADRRLEVDRFADAGFPECLEMAAEAGRRLGFPESLLDALVALFPTGGAPKGPYLQMLHFQCVLGEFYDHDLSTIYEFNPRGEASEWLFAQYPASLEVAGNPFLNNAKSVDRLGYEWARSKKVAQRSEAYALVQIIAGLDSMGFAARRELSSWLRQLLARRIRLAEGSAVELPRSFTRPEARRLLDAVGAKETGTRGIIEQRMVDAASSLRHPSPRWIARGLTDSVNATNVSRRKCGDCDFQDAGHQAVVAYEAHAGTLTDVYVRAHVRTLARILGVREREWAENVGPDLKWSVKVVFISHETDLAELPMPVEIGNATVDIETMSYDDLFAPLDGADAAVADALRRYVLEPLELGRTPDSVRERLLALL